MRNRSPWSVMRLCPLWVVMILALVSSGVYAAPVSVSGTVYVDGAPARAIQMQLIFPDGAVHEVESGEGGKFECSIERGDRVVILPRNEGYLAPGAKTFLIGGAVLKNASEVTVPLSTKPMVEKLVVLDNKQKVDWSSTAVNYKMIVPMGNGLPDWSDRSTLRPGKLGGFRVNIPKVAAKHSFTIHSELPNHRLATASQKLNTEALVAASPYRLHVNLLTPTLVVKPLWTDKAGGGPVKRPKDGDLFAYGLMLQPSGNSAVIDGEGVARFYEVNSGKYKLVFTTTGRQQFSIVSPSESVVVPADVKSVVHVVRVKPTVHASIGGLVIQEGTSQAISTATVEANGVRVLTDEHGRFTLSTTGAIRVVHVNRKHYVPAEIRAPFKRPLVVVLRQWTDFRGSVRVNGVAPKNAKIRLYTAGNAESIRVGRDGNWGEPLKPGKYFMTVRSRDIIDGAGEAVTPDEMVPVLLYQGVLQFDKSDKPRAVKVPHVSLVDVYTNDQGGPSALAAMLLNKDGRILLSSRFSKNRARFKVVPGNYKVAVIYADHRAKIAELAVVENEKTILKINSDGRRPVQIKTGHLVVKKQ